MATVANGAVRLSIDLQLLFGLYSLCISKKKFGFCDGSNFDNSHRNAMSPL